MPINAINSTNRTTKQLTMKTDFTISAKKWPEIEVTATSKKAKKEFKKNYGHDCKIIAVDRDKIDAWERYYFSEGYRFHHSPEYRFWRGEK